MTTLFAKLPTLVWPIKISNMAMAMLKRYLNLQFYTPITQSTHHNTGLEGNIQGDSQLLPGYFGIFFISSILPLFVLDIVIVTSTKVSIIIEQVINSKLYSFS